MSFLRKENVMSIEGKVGDKAQTIKGKVVTIPVADKTLTKDGYAADAKETGDRLRVLAEQVGLLSAKLSKGE
jgi:hypothetical protein